nr:MAG TPA: hypothetical protein [Bacteriophage sp.]
MSLWNIIIFGRHLKLKISFFCNVMEAINIVLQRSIYDRP